MSRRGSHRKQRQEYQCPQDETNYFVGHITYILFNNSQGDSGLSTNG
jgi:hypothetical protein